MKVLHVINGLGSGGAENLINNLLPMMKNEGLEVKLLILTKKDSMYYKTLVKHVEIIVSPIENIRSYRQIKFIKTFIENGNFDIVHAHLFPTLYWVSLAVNSIKKRIRPKLLYTEHSTNNRRRKWCFRTIERCIYKPYDKIITISDGVRHNLTMWLGKRQAAKIVTINNGIPLDKFREASPYQKDEFIEGFKKTDKLILMVGRFSNQKDQKTLIKAMSLLPGEYKLILVGEGPNEISCKSLVNELGLSERTFFLGRRTDIERITKTVDLCVISSHWEGFGLVAVEAMAAGKIVIGSDVPGLKEVINDIDFLFNKGDYIQLKEKILVCLEKNNKNMKSYFDRIENFNIETMMINYLKLYK